METGAKSEKSESANRRLNDLVAVTVVILTVFMGFLCCLYLKCEPERWSACQRR